MDTPDILAILGIQDEDESNGNIGYTDKDKNNGNIVHTRQRQMR